MQQTWLSKIFKIRFFANNRKSNELPDSLWKKCDSCQRTSLVTILQKNLYVCDCGYHFRIAIDERINQLFDAEYETLEMDIKFNDPIQFKDLKAYQARFEDAQKKTGQKEAFQIIHGNIDTQPCIMLIMNFDFIGGSMGTAVGNAIKYAVENAIQRKLPLIILTASGGARMQEGLFSLMQMPKTTIAVERLKAHGLPFISLLTHPTTGGVLASFAMRGSLTIAEPDSIIGFTGPRVIESVMKVKLPENFQTPEFVKQKGFIDHVVHRKELKKFLAKAITILCHQSNDVDANTVQNTHDDTHTEAA